MNSFESISKKTTEILKECGWTIQFKGIQKRYLYGNIDKNYLRLQHGQYKLFEILIFWSGPVMFELKTENMRITIMSLPYKVIEGGQFIQFLGQKCTFYFKRVGSTVSQHRYYLTNKFCTHL